MATSCEKPEWHQEIPFLKKSKKICNKSERAANTSITHAYLMIMNKETSVSENKVALNRSEKNRLARLEKTISKGWETFLDVGRALSAIREEQLYRNNYPTFEAYCQDKWQMGRSYAGRLIGTVEIMEELSENLDDGVALPQNEAQARCLKELNSDQRIEFWGGLMKEKGEEPLTAQKIRDHLKEYLGQESENHHDEDESLKTPKRIMRQLEKLVRELENMGHKELSDRYLELYEETQELLSGKNH